MNQLEANLAALYATPRQADDWQWAVRYAPRLRLDANEPFRPLAAGYTIFRENGRSPSFPRTIKRRGRAGVVIEYAIWWDWDIHHLYELEHVWVYLDGAGRVRRVEGSWHRKVKRLDENGRPPPYLFASPGKHAFAPQVAHFKAQHRRTPGITSRYAGSGGIAGNGLFNGQLPRTPPGDRLIATYLKGKAFTPAWDFSPIFRFRDEMLVPWPVLRDWIPERVRQWQAYLARTIPPDKLQFICTAVCHTPAAILRAGQNGAEMAQINVTGLWETLVSLRACHQARLAAYLVLRHQRAIPWLAWLLRRRDWSDYLMTGSENPALVAQMKARLPHYRTAIILPHPSAAAVTAAQAVSANYVHVLHGDRMTPAWVAKMKRAALGVVSGPVAGETAVSHLQSLGIEAIVVVQ